MHFLSRFYLLVFFIFFHCPIHAQNWGQVMKRVAADRTSTDEFGFAVAVDGEWAMVGVILEDEDASGNNTLNSSGSVYILKKVNGNWTQVQKIVSSDRAANDYFGSSIAVNGDYAIIGAPSEDEDINGNNSLTNSGSAYIFKNNSGTWNQVQKIVASDRGGLDFFGKSVDINGDYIVIGAYYEDQNASGGSFLDESGSAYIFKNNSGTWSQVQKIVASDRQSYDYFGSSVSIDGDYVIVGAHEEDHNTSGSGFLNNSGSAYIFKNNSGTWSQVQKIVASDRGAIDFFGFSVDISGAYAIVGAYSEDHDANGNNAMSESGSAYIFKNNSGTWSQIQKIVASDRAGTDFFGHSVSISSDFAIIGAYSEDEDALGANTLSVAGSAYIFKNTGSSWNQIQKIVAPDRNSNDQFGWSVAIDKHSCIIGAKFEDEDELGSNTASSAGSVYVFTKLCAIDLPLPSSYDTTYTADYSSTDSSGWTHYCSQNDKLILSLKIGSSGAVIATNQVQLKLGPRSTYGWIGNDNGLITSGNKGYQIIDRRWNVNPTTQPNSGNIDVRTYFTNNHFNDIKDSLLLHGPNQNGTMKTTLNSVSDLTIYIKSSGAAFDSPHLVTGQVLNHGTTPSTSIWNNGTHGASDHYAEFKVSSLTGGGIGAGGGGGLGNAPLPVELIFFEASPINYHRTLVKWTTASEINNDYFTVLRSYDGISFEEIKEIKGKGNSSKITHYEFTDSTVNYTKLVVYYKLKQTDNDKIFTMYETRKVSFKNKNITSIQLFPNPTQNKIYASFDSKIDGQISLIDQVGKELMIIPITQNDLIEINLTNFDRGIYFLIFNSKDRFIIVKN